MKTYTTTDGNTINKIGRAKRIYFDTKGTYFMWNGRRERLENISRLTYPIMYEDENGKIGVIGGYITICNVYGVLVELDTDREVIQLWEEANA